MLWEGQNASRLFCQEQMAAHFISANELKALVCQINKRLAQDPDVGSRIPIDPPEKVMAINSSCQRMNASRSRLIFVAL